MKPLIMCLFCVFTALPAKAAELLMFESDYCIWCEAWHRQIGPQYGATQIGRIAQLRRVDMENRPRAYDGITGVIYSPTFVLVENGREIGRIVGYQGRNAFWSRLAQLMRHRAP